MSALPEVLTVADVMDRYKLSDRRAARRVMAEAGLFRVGRRLRVRADRLDEWERAQEASASAPPRTQEEEPLPPRPKRRRRSGQRTAGERTYGPGFWRPGDDAA